MVKAERLHRLAFFEFAQKLCRARLPLGSRRAPVGRNACQMRRVEGEQSRAVTFMKLTCPLLVPPHGAMRFWGRRPFRDSRA